MTSISIKHDNELQLETKAQTVDLTAFHRYDSLAQTERLHLTGKCRHDLTAFHRLDQDKSCTGTNFALLQWRVVDGTAQCNLITIARRTRQTSPDKSATASNTGRYAQ